MRGGGSAGPNWFCPKSYSAIAPSELCKLVSLTKRLVMLKGWENFCKDWIFPFSHQRRCGQIAAQGSTDKDIHHGSTNPPSSGLYLPPAKSSPRSSSLLILPMSMSKVSVSQSWVSSVSCYYHVQNIQGLGISTAPADQCQWQSLCCDSVRQIFEASGCERPSPHTRFSHAAPCSLCSPAQVCRHQHALHHHGQHWIRPTQSRLHFLYHVKCLMNGLSKTPTAF